MTVRHPLLLLASILLAGCTGTGAEWTFAGNQTPAVTPLRLAETAPPVTVGAGGNTLQPVLDYIQTPRHAYTNRAAEAGGGTLRMDAGERLTARTTGTVARLELRLLQEDGGGASPQRSQAANDAQQVTMQNIRAGTYTGLVRVRPERITYRYRFRLRVRVRVR